MIRGRSEAGLGNWSGLQPARSRATGNAYAYGDHYSDATLCRQLKRRAPFAGPTTPNFANKRDWKILNW